MKVKLFLILATLGTFNFFLASTTDIIEEPLTQKTDNHFDTKDRYSITGDVVLDAPLVNGEILVFLYHQEQYDYLSEVSKQTPFINAICRTTVNSQGAFILDVLSESLYDLRFVYLRDDLSYLPLQAITLGNIDLQHLQVEEGTDLQIELSYTPALVSN